LAATPETTCGDCSLGDWTCNDDGSDVECVGDPGTNACGSCETLDGTPGTSCTCGGSGDARWTCSGPNVVCDDGDDFSGSPRDLGSGSEYSDPVVQSRTSDEPGDVDWYTQWGTDEFGRALTPFAEVTPSAGLELQVCIFFAYSGSADITNYSCRAGSCHWYDSSTGAVASSNCNNVPDGFTGADLLGCCDTTTDGDGQYHARIESIDGLNDASGLGWLRVEATGGLAAAACQSYTLEFGF